MKSQKNNPLPLYIDAENDAPAPGDLIHAPNDGQAAVFEIQQDNSLFIPYGDYPHDKGLQKFDRTAAEELRAAANSLLAKTAGIPIYAGHPDVPGRQDSNPSAPAHGWVDDIQIENDGIRIAVRWNKRGRESIENADYRFYSPYWMLKRVTGGLQPVRLRSIGLTNNPRIPVPAIANDDDPGADASNSTKEPDTMNEEQKKLLGLANDATPEQINERLKALVQAENDLADTKTKLTTAENDLTAAREEAKTAKADAEKKDADISAANDRATAARETLVDAALDRAVESGHLSEGDRADKRAGLLAIENDDELKTGLGQLTAGEPKLKTGSKTGDLGDARAHLAAENDAEMRSIKRREAIAAEMENIANDVDPGERYNLAYSRAEKKNPELFNPVKES